MKPIRKLRGWQKKPMISRPRQISCRRIIRTVSRRREKHLTQPTQLKNKRLTVNNRSVLTSGDARVHCGSSSIFAAARKRPEAALSLSRQHVRERDLVWARAAGALVARLR